MLVKPPPTTTSNNNNLPILVENERHQTHPQPPPYYNTPKSSLLLAMMDVTVFGGRIRASHICICILIILNIAFQFHNNLYHHNLSDLLFMKTTPTTNSRMSATIRQGNNNNNNNNNDELIVQYGDSIYTQIDWDGAPVVIEKYKLLFFTSPKVGCTIWKQLFRRMMNVSNYTEESYDTMLPWNPELNNITYLYHYNRTMASYMMTHPSWTRAIFVRDPKERFLSAYLDKVIYHEQFTIQKCCPYSKTCVNPAKESINNFIPLMRTCTDSHWNPQSKRIVEEKYWPYINYVGHMDNVYNDAKRLLQQIGAWEEYGKSGWGGNNSNNNGTQDAVAIFQSMAGSTGRIHATNATMKLKSYITPELEHELEQYYADDYNNIVLNLTLRKIY